MREINYLCPKQLDGNVECSSCQLGPNRGTEEETQYDFTFEKQSARVNTECLSRSTLIIILEMFSVACEIKIHPLGGFVTVPRLVKSLEINFRRKYRGAYKNSRANREREL